MADKLGEARTPDKNYADWVCSISGGRRQASPFIVFSEGFFNCVYYLDSLLKFPDDAKVFHTWPGQWKSDVFYYKLGTMRKQFAN